MPAAVATNSAARGVAVPKDAAMEYMRRHDLKQLFEELSTELVVQQPEKPREFVYDLLGRMLELPPRDAAAATQDKTPHGFEKVKLVVENVGSDGTVRTRRCTGTFPVNIAQTRAARLQWEQGAAAALHAMVWSAGASADPAAEVGDETVSAEPKGGDDEMEAMRLEIEELREQVEELEYEAQQIKNAAKHHVQEVEEENEALKEAVEESQFEFKSFRAACDSHVAHLEEELESLREQLDDALFDGKQIKAASEAHVAELEQELERARGKVVGEDA